MRLQRSKSYRAEAILLRRSNLGEADRIVTLYTREYGKRRAVAKSVRRSKSRLAGHIELFTHVDVYLAVGTNLDVLTQATAIEIFPTMSNDLDRFAKASWAAEVVDRLTLVGEPDPELFALLLATIRLLASEDERRSIHLRQFELHALSRLGYRPHLESCVNCGGGLKEMVNQFSPGLGGVMCHGCDSDGAALTISPSAIKVMRWLESQEIGTAGRLNSNAALDAELERIHTACLNQVLGGMLRSASLLDRSRTHNAARPV